VITPYFCLNVKAKVWRCAFFAFFSVARIKVPAVNGAKTAIEGVYHLLQPFGYFHDAMWRTMNSFAAFTSLGMQFDRLSGARRHSVFPRQVIGRS
jgi:hypothetical protein